MSNKQRAKPRGAYLTDIVTLHQSGRLPLIPGTIGVLDILHEPDCRRPDGGPCTCHAEIGDITYPRIDPPDDDRPTAA